MHTPIVWFENIFKYSETHLSEQIALVLGVSVGCSLGSCGAVRCWSVSCRDLQMADPPAQRRFPHSASKLVLLSA